MWCCIFQDKNLSYRGVIVNKLCTLLIMALAVSTMATADDLYRVTIGSHPDAEILLSADIEPVYRLIGPYDPRLRA